MVLFWREDHDLTTSGTAMQVTAVFIAAIAFVALALVSIMAIVGA